MIILHFVQAQLLYWFGKETVRISHDRFNYWTGLHEVTLMVTGSMILLAELGFS
jgi:hypothetical protein